MESFRTIVWSRLGQKLDQEDSKATFEAAKSKHKVGMKLFGKPSSSFAKLTSDKSISFSDMRKELEWVRQVTGNCNAETCNEEGNCMTKADLAPSVVKRFETVTPHLQK